MADTSSEGGDAVSPKVTTTHEDIANAMDNEAKVMDNEAKAMESKAKERSSFSDHLYAAASRIRSIAGENETLKKSSGLLKRDYDCMKQEHHTETAALKGDYDRLKQEHHNETAALKGDYDFMKQEHHTETTALKAEIRRLRLGISRVHKSSRYAMDLMGGQQDQFDDRANRTAPEEQDDIDSDLENVSDGSQDPEDLPDDHLQGLGPDPPVGRSMPHEDQTLESVSDYDTAKPPAKRKRASRRRPARVSASSANQSEH